MKQMKQGINKALALFLAVVLAFSPIAAAFGDSMTVYATEASTESETQRSRSAADLHEALETRAETETKAVQNDNKISDDTEKDDGDTTGSGNSSSNGNSSNGGNSDNGGSTRETPAQPTTQEYTVNLPGKIGGVDFGTVTLTVKGQDYPASADNKVTLPAKLETADITAVKNNNYNLSDVSVEGTTIKIEKATPNVSIESISGSESITVGNTGEYEATLSNEAWANEIQWILSDSDVAIQGSDKGKKVSIKANEKGFGSAGQNEKKVTLSVQIGSVRIEKEIKLQKKAITDLKVEFGEKSSWKKGVDVKVSSAELQKINAKVSVVAKKGEAQIEDTKMLTVGGEAQKWTFKENGSYVFTATFEGNAVYQSQAVTGTYDTDKENQDAESFKLVTGSNVKETTDSDGNIIYEIVNPLIYGDSKHIASIVAEDTYKNEAWYYRSDIKDSTTNENSENLIALNENGEISFTAKQANQGEDSYTVVLTRWSNNYNEKSLTFKIKVVKKEIEVKTVTATDKIYDGTTTVEIKTTLPKAAFVEGDTSEDIDLTGSAEAESSDAAQSINVKGENMQLQLSDKLAKNYTLTGINELSTTVTISKRKVITKVIQKPEKSNEKMEMVSDGEPIKVTRPFTEISKTDDLVVAYLPEDKQEKTGFVGDEVPNDLIVPGVKVSQEATDQSLNEEYKQYYVPDFSAERTMANYEFDTNAYTGANLIIIASSIGINSKVIYVDSGNSKNVYQSGAGETIYYKGMDNPEIEFSINNKETQAEYTKIFMETENGWTELENRKYSPDTAETEITLNLKLQTNAHGESSSFSLTLQRDNTVPTANISIGVTTSAYSFAGNVTFGIFKNEEFTASITTSDDPNKGNENKDTAVSGVQYTKYAVIELDGDKQYAKYENGYETNSSESESKIEQLVHKNDDGSVYVDEKKFKDFDGEPVKIGVGTDSANYVVFALVVDKVGNAALYGSNGVVFDKLKLDSLDLNYETKKSDNSPKGDKVAYFKNEAILSATAEDGQSAVKKIEATVRREDQKESETETVTMFELPDGNYTLEELGRYKKVDTHKKLESPIDGEVRTDIKETINSGECYKYEVSVTAEDMAGNPVKNPQDPKNETTKTFVLDRLAPEISINRIEKMKKEHMDSGVYYSNEAVTITTVVKERFIDDSLIKLELKKDNGSYGPATLKDWVSYARNNPNEVEVTVDKEKLLKNNDATTTINFTIYPTDGEEHEYAYYVSATDYSGNNSELNNAIRCCLDQKKPDVKITYTPTNKDNQQEAALSPGSGIIYLGEDYKRFDVAIEIEENYFKKSDGTVLVTYGAGDNLISATNSSNKPIEEEGDLQTMAKSLTSVNINTWKDKGSNSYRFNHSYTADANYTFPDFTVTDLAGNKTTVNGAKITLDKVRPTGTLTVANLVSGGTKGEISWNKLVSKLSFGLFGKNSVKVSMSSEDATAGLKSTQYIVTDTLKKRSELEAETKWKDYKKGNVLKLNKNRNYIVYEKVIDKAGNTDYFGTDRVVVDGNSPKPEVTITPSAPGWGKGVYSASDNPRFDILVTDPIENDSYAGLKSVTYTISGGANGYKESNTVTFTAKDHRQSYTGHVNIDPSRFYSNNVQVTVEAVDYSTNGASKQTEEIKIDNQAPKVSFSFDKSDAVGGKYYNKDKTLTITVDERNFDDSYKPEVTSSTNQGWSFSGWSGNGEKHTGTITFTGDADYTVSYFCYDKAGNKSNTEKLDEITIDKTKPTVAVSYDNNNAKNGSYYQEGRTATITITEHNFNASGVTVTTTANLDGGSVAVPQASGWSSSGDTHTATISYPTDGDYTFTISITDMASNVSDPYATDSFTVDLTKPTIEISNIEDHSANKGTVAPVVTLNDTNFDRSNVNIQLTGVHKGVVNTANMYTTADTGKGQVITFANFGKNMDDIYTLKAETTDKAGNAYSTEIVFSVNRDGSTYQYNDYTEELLKKGYTNNPKDIVVSEINVDSLTLSELTLSKNGTVLTLKEGQDYDVQKSGGDVSWKEYVYTIHAANFEDEGDYTISIYSEDKAKNKTTNTSKAKQVEFIVDKTSPVISVANLQEGGHYKTDEQEFTANVDDNMALDKVEYYVDGELKESFDEKAVIEQNGALKLKVGSAAKFQEVSVKAYDKADNEPTIVTMNVLVSASGWVQFYNNKPLFFGTIILILLIVVGGVIIVMRVNRNGSLKMTTNRKEQRK